MISRKIFLECIKSIEKQFSIDRKCSEAFKVILPNDYTTTYDNSSIIDTFIKLLKELTKDEDEWIDYYIYELDFGRKYKSGMVKFKGKNIKLSTYLDLWNIITKKK